MWKLLDMLGLSGVVLSASLLAVGAWGGWQWIAKNHVQHQLETLRTSNAMAQAAIAKQHAERYAQLTEDFAKTSAKHKAKNDEIERDRKRLTDDLRTARRKLQDHWTCPSPGAEDTPGSPGVDGKARLREESAGRIIANADRADAWIESLQEIIRKLQNGRVAPGQK